MARFAEDPLGFVRYAFPWGEGELADYDGPDQWAVDVLAHLTAELRKGTAQATAIQVAVASGHGIGKSALMAWLILWCLSTMEDSLGMVTANTEPQLRTKTWPQVVKWYQLCITRRWFRLTDTTLCSVQESHEKTWRFDRVTWSEHNTEAFAGLHNQGKRLLILFDEASNIADKVWEVTEGALTDANTQIVWVVFGNPTRNVGRFHACFHGRSHRWWRRQVDSRTVKITNKRELQQRIEDEGIDSDTVKVRVLGQFPLRASNQLIGSDVVAEAGRRPALADAVRDPLVISIDVARFGDDATVIRRRRGKDARTLPKVKLQGADSTQVASHVARLVKEHEARGEVVDGILIDTTGGYGGAVFDRLVELGYAPIAVEFGSKAPDESYANMRAYIWGMGAAWLKAGGAIDGGDVDLVRDLTQQTYSYNARDQVLLTSKEAMKADGLASPDDGDALMVSFAVQLATAGTRRAQELEGSVAGRAALTEYDPFDTNSRRL